MMGTFQQRTWEWLVACFGDPRSTTKQRRVWRFVEESLELAQASGCTAEEARQVLDYVFSRPIGEPHQEVGGVMVTLAGVCVSSGLDMEECAETELARVWTKVEVIRAKEKAKQDDSALPGPSSSELALT